MTKMLVRHHESVNCQGTVRNFVRRYRRDLIIRNAIVTTDTSLNADEILYLVVKGSARMRVHNARTVDTIPLRR